MEADTYLDTADRDYPVYLWKKDGEQMKLFRVCPTHKRASEYIMEEFGRLIEPFRIKNWINENAAIDGVYLTNTIKWKENNYLKQEESEIRPLHKPFTLNFE